MIIFGSLSGVYVIPTIYYDYVRLDHAATGSNKNSLVPSPGSDGVSSSPQQHIGEGADGFARNAVGALHRKAKELRANSSVVNLYLCFW